MPLLFGQSTIKKNQTDVKGKMESDTQGKID
jgi:hypothetical protein